MQKINEKIAALPPGATFHSLEFFPPKTEMVSPRWDLYSPELTSQFQGFQNLTARLERMALALRPLFVTVTWSAGGSSSARSLQLAEVCQRQLELTTCLHLTCTNMSRRIIDEALETAKEIGIRNILALRGDQPRNDEYADQPDEEDDGREEFVWAVDLVRYIRKKYRDYFCIGVAAYPEGYAEGTMPVNRDPRKDLPYLVEKVKAGADFIMTQLFYDVDQYVKFEKMLREEESGVLKDMVILPGLMPMQSYHLLRRTTKLAHASLPWNVQQSLEGVKNDDANVKAVGVDILSEIVTRLKEELPARPLGFHFYTLNLEKVVSFILERTSLIPPADDSVFLDEEVDSASGPLKRLRTTSGTTDPNNHLIVDSLSNRRDSSMLEPAETAGLLQSLKASEQRPDVALAISEGEGTLGREATWDDFPNGRFGDARSPAFSTAFAPAFGGYGPILQMPPAQAVQLWGYPVTKDDISELFVRHLTRDLPSLPWSEGEEGLSEEFLIIQSELVGLNKRGWWTVASQPAVNGVRSDDETFGWGPKGGFVYQKAFVEFFCPPDDLERLETKLRKLGDEVSFYAANTSGGYKSNMSVGKDDRNAVTWGSFKAKEYVSPFFISLFRKNRT
jgi:methylenetetrahydrofolate reductase (NADPH)